MESSGGSSETMVYDIFSCPRCEECEFTTWKHHPYKVKYFCRANNVYLIDDGREALHKALPPCPDRKPGRPKYVRIDYKEIGDGEE